jgi:chemotaxis response regulator CheB
LKILIADDSTAIRNIIRKFIERAVENPIIIECSDGDEAVVIQKKEIPDLILIDIMMKRIDGFEAISQIKRHSPLSKIFVISQLPEDEYKAESINVGAIEFLNKENLSELPNLIKKYFR